MVFVLCVLVSFASGTAFGSMGVIFPISVPTAYALDPNSTALMVTTIAATIGGSTAGDNCSPFSDTTILSATLSKIPNLQHTKTQLPYALMAILTAIVFGYLPVGFNLYNEWVANVIQIGFLGLVFFLFGTNTGSFHKGAYHEPKFTEPLFLIGFRKIKALVQRRGGRREEYTTL
jgi:Na+/H+ antiporter NhaC